MALPLQIPEDLRELVVTQDYAAYTVEDHAVWRFSVKHTHRRLLETAHPAYASGFEAAGIEIDRIAQIARMNERLAAIGWSAVCVDGFIPPRAFQEFQAHRILPIAADIRTRAHLTYTPAPDIIHEAAGHAPFLADSSYARFLMRIGDVGRRAFTTPADRAIYEAIFTLSEVKEDPSATPDQIARAQARLEQAVAEQGEPSEAALLSRLYWWTVEYGMVGALSAPKLYGAGLLSSIGEGYFCEDPNVRKLPLSAGCIEVPYDITRPQPQLFVAESFEQLEAVLDDVADSLSQRRGGLCALEAALDSKEVATLVLEGGEKLIANVLAIDARAGEPTLVVLDEGRVLWLRDGSKGAPPSAPPGAGDGEADRAAWRRYLEARGLGAHANESQQFLAAPSLASAHAGGAEPALVGSRRSSVRVPKPRERSAADAEMLTLFERAHEAFAALGGARLAVEAEAIKARLDQAYPDEWLLRYELLEGLVQASSGRPPGHALQDQLIADLERLELRYQGREPIATGLSYVRSLIDDSSADRSRTKVPA